MKNFYFYDLYIQILCTYIIPRARSDPIPIKIKLEPINFIYNMRAHACCIMDKIYAYIPVYTYEYMKRINALPTRFTFARAYIYV